MTYERAIYYKILLSVGEAEELKAYIEERLSTEEAYGDPLLDLALCGSDARKMYEVLSEYAAFRSVDQGEVFDLVWHYFGGLYFSQKYPLATLLSKLRLAESTMTAYFGEGEWENFLWIWNAYDDIGLFYSREQFDTSLSEYFRSKEWHISAKEQVPARKGMFQRLLSLFRRKK